MGSALAATQADQGRKDQARAREESIPGRGLVPEGKHEQAADQQTHTGLKDSGQGSCLELNYQNPTGNRKDTRTEKEGSTRPETQVGPSEISREDRDAQNLRGEPSH